MSVVEVVDVYERCGVCGCICISVWVCVQCIGTGVRKCIVCTCMHQDQTYVYGGV